MANSTEIPARVTLDDMICFSLYSASNAMIRAYRPILDALNLTYSQYIVMLVMWEKECLSVKALGEKVHLDSGTLTPLLKRLEGKGLVSRKRSETDERVREISLTDAGKALQQNAQQVPAALFCKLDMPLETLKALKSTCDTLYTQLSAVE
ncbi:MarR family transcriptional regulator [Photobacterium sp. WH77]|uniref:MarR family winged helix-turn-helix transcriptional regulator n=1 Tax=unclassified Photobacterium TaxID=2628852 RepID=UPI001EDB50BD|nr:MULTISPECIES: MarR family transcriptional regulator [unclassified Photobacterium]MCG2837802.1 MarR family transcriptional regulator [Photobacterium sp. WH77]MCG2845418.1 MarR family transcriptional regulator [Photobacterium sp. WH80]